MYKFYKMINKVFYAFGKVLLVGAVAAYEVNNLLDNFVIFYYLAYCLLAIQTGISLIDAYTNNGLRKGSKKSSFLELKVENKMIETYKTKHLTIDLFGKDIEMYVDELKNKKLDKLIIQTPFKEDCVILRIDEYERLKNLFEKGKGCQMN